MKGGILEVEVLSGALNTFEGGTYESSVTLSDGTELVVILASSHGGGRVIAQLLLNAGLGSSDLGKGTLENQTFLKFERFPKKEVDEKMYHKKLDELGKPPVLIKSGLSLWRIPLTESYGKPKYIHITTDGRDMAFKPWTIADKEYDLLIPGMPSTDLNFPRKAEWWQRSNFQPLALVPTDRYLHVRLEDIVNDPNGEATRICEWLGLEPVKIDQWVRTPGALGKWREQLDHPNYPEVFRRTKMGLITFGYPLE